MEYKRLYYVIGKNENGYIYKMILGKNINDVKNEFLNMYPDYNIDTLKLIKKRYFRGI